ncbi:MAG TPA: hypothetical protein VH206_19680 [Xanthobacteraceae bacterium]|jgi:hypothetical protein|nr:hypothetical protein [Xanthobacteraceae bacterium]
METPVIARRTARALRRILKLSGFAPSVHLDFSNRLTSTKHLDAMLDRIAETVECWLSQQTIFTDLAPFSVRELVGDFFAAHLSGPLPGRRRRQPFQQDSLALLARASAMSEYYH